MESFGIHRLLSPPSGIFGEKRNRSGTRVDLQLQAAIYVTSEADTRDKWPVYDLRRG